MTYFIVTGKVAAAELVPNAISQIYANRLKFDELDLFDWVGTSVQAIRTLYGFFLVSLLSNNE